MDGFYHAEAGAAVQPVAGVRGRVRTAGADVVLGGRDVDVLGAERQAAAPGHGVRGAGLQAPVRNAAGRADTRDGDGRVHVAKVAAAIVLGTAALVAAIELYESAVIALGVMLGTA